MNKGEQDDARKEYKYLAKSDFTPSSPLVTTEIPDESFAADFIL